MAKKRLGDLLLELKAKTPRGDADARARSRSSRRSTPRSWRAAGWARSWSRCASSPRRTCCRRSGSSSGSPYRPDLKADDVDVDLATSIPIGFAKQHRLLVVKREGDSAMVATADPLEIGALDDLRMQLQLEVQPFLVPSQRILEVINDVYGRKARQGRRPRREGGRGRRGEQRGAGRHPRRHRRGADHPLGQLAAVQRRQGAGQRYPHRAGREGGHRPLPHRRRAVRVARARRGSSCRRSSRA